MSQKLNVSGAFLILSSKVAENAAIVGKMKKNHRNPHYFWDFPDRGLNPHLLEPISHLLSPLHGLEKGVFGQKKSQFSTLSIF